MKFTLNIIESSIDLPTYEKNAINFQRNVAMHEINLTVWMLTNKCKDIDVNFTGAS